MTDAEYKKEIGKLMLEMNESVKILNEEMNKGPIGTKAAVQNMRKFSEEYERAVKERFLT